MSIEEESAYDASSGSDFESAAPAKRKKTSAAPKRTANPIKANGPPAKRQKLQTEIDENDEMDVDTSPVQLSKPAKASGKGKTIEETYKKMSQLDHVLKRPDTYIGSVEKEEATLWVVEDGKMVQRAVSYAPGLYKIFDEILVNAADNKIRDPTMDTIKVDIDKESNTISVYNNGKGIPVEIHAEEKVYVPELIFGHLLTSSNYDDEEKKVTGGRNGYGAKLCNIFSTEFVVETSSEESGHKFRQVYNNNMSKRGAPKLTKPTKEDFTKITFKPDLAKFKMTELDDDIVAVMRKRVYDVAGVVRDVKVYLNGERIKVKSFKDYVKLYLESGKEAGEGGSAKGVTSVLYERPNERWEVCFAVSEGGQFQQRQTLFPQISFVNSICTTKGGTHVNNVVDQIVHAATDALKKKDKNLNPKAHQIKSNIWIFINSLIENPTFDSQTKENLTLKATKFGSKPTLSEEFLKKVMKSGLLENVLTLARAKESQALKKSDGTKRARISGIAKLDDANNAGTKNAQACTLILTEGDSAKALAISGLSVVGRDNFGVFPLRGKLLNVRDAPGSTILKNEEIGNIKQILGLKQGERYESTKSLRYGHVMIMTDQVRSWVESQEKGFDVSVVLMWFFGVGQDHDGSHIKGLLINLFDHFWPSLLQQPGFLLQFITPIIRVTKGNREVNFYTIPEYENWRESHNDGKGWNVKYYKGLGTSTAADAKKYFSRMDDHLKPFKKMGDEDRGLIDLAFNKKKADDRKEWLKDVTAGTFIDNAVDEISISDFVNKELVLFSMADNVRSIPSLVDGLKPGQRKILFSCFKRNLTKQEIKVAQLAGYVSEHSAYHHGEQSLCSTIVGLAQDYVGSNNLNLLEPRGQFGTRLQGGKDAAHARYIFTRLPAITRMIFHPSDDKLLAYQNEENMSIEPEWYIPILPMVLVNGAEGIGTGWSTSIPNYNPRDIVRNLRRLMDGEDFIQMHPWYRKFKGSIDLVGDKYKISGKINKIDDTTLEITELPIESWTQGYKEFLEKMMKEEGQGFSIRDYKEYHTDTAVHFVVQLTEENMKRAEREGLEGVFKISKWETVGNMVLFGRDGRLRKYAGCREIVEEFYELRLEYYEKRKDWLLAELNREWTKLDNQVRFIQEVIVGDLVVQNRKKADVIEELKERRYVAIEKGKEGDAVEDAALVEEGEGDSTKHGYDYLLSMPIWNLTKEKVEKLKEDRDKKLEELEILKATSPKDLWREDLDRFMDEWDHIEIEVEASLKNAASTKGKKGAKVNVAAARLKNKFKKKAVKTEEWESDVDDGSDGDDYVEKKGKSAAVAPRQTAPRRKLVGNGVKKTATNDMELDDFFGDSFGRSIKTKQEGSPNGVEPNGVKTETAELANGSIAEEVDLLMQRKQAKITDLFRPKATATVEKQPAEVVDITMDSDEVTSTATTVKAKPDPKAKAPAKSQPKPKPAAKKPPAKPAKSGAIVLSEDEDEANDDPFSFTPHSPVKKPAAKPGPSSAPKAKEPAKPANKRAVVEADLFSGNESDDPVVQPPRKKSKQQKVVMSDDEDDDVMDLDGPFGRNSPVRRSSRATAKPKKAIVVLDSDEEEEWVENGGEDADDGSSYGGDN
ncbi:DNA topoisomerase 2 [Rhizophlyctis rosea]|uniref:DNA topoisomerase 2 n=1 Tax=Rhizophlyctis rosea TaxID=64517 RepID=A0AAD5S5F4_9FUNG|nr:DNA topoisomerase 2 [Rhizophlyctis rosea]